MKFSQKILDLYHAELTTMNKNDSIVVSNVLSNCYIF